MPQKKCRVELLAHTPEPLALIYAAFRQCYHAGDVADMPVGLNDDPSRDVAFALSGVSRALTHQLVRHRIASYSQQSQRYVDASAMDYVVPPAIAADPRALARFEACMDGIGSAYRELKALLEAGGRGKNANEDARFVLPQAAATSIVVTMNCRSLLQFFEQRCCSRAQWEIRGAARSMLEHCRRVLPEIFRHAGAKCERLGYCPEGEKFTCGRYPLPEKR